MAMMSGNRPLRFGLLGAARIARNGLIDPARRVPGVEVAAIAARDPARAHAFARRYGIPRVHASYAALIADPAVDAIYNPLPNSLHAVWTIRALEAGKHVLCEKPFAANAAEAAQMAAAAESAGRVLMEAFHYRYHPLMARLLAIVQSGELGAIRHLEASMCTLMLRRGDIRLRYELAGGALMDVGCYAVNLVRALAGAEPEVVRAHARLHAPKVDREMQADLRFPGGQTGRITCALRSRRLVNFSARVEGEQGRLVVANPYLPHLYHHLTVQTAAGKRRERLPGDTTYTYQLRAFVAAVRESAPFPTTAADAVANMRVIDAVYQAAGLPLRSTD